jgi:calcineurin-like phosphoesterase
MSGWSYCGQQYQPISNLNRISDGDVAKVIGTVTRDLRIDNSLVDARSGILGDFKSTGPAGTVRVVPGRTIGK